MHLPGVTVSQQEAIGLRDVFVSMLDAQDWSLPAGFDKYVDTSVYKPPKLRVPGADKAQQCVCSPTPDVVDPQCTTCGGKGRVNLGRAYAFRNAFRDGQVDVAIALKLRGSLLQTLLTCDISSNKPLSSGAPVVQIVKAAATPVGGPVIDCVRSVLSTRGMPTSGIKITAKQDVLFVDVAVQNFVCANVNRAHRRNGPFFILRRSGQVQQRCRDDECSKKGQEYVVELGRLLPSEAAVLFPEDQGTTRYPDHVRLWIAAATTGPVGKRKREGMEGEQVGKGRKGGKNGEECKRTKRSNW
jgi:hypothetical protein